jgi:hypothetical protein
MMVTMTAAIRSFCSASMVYRRPQSRTGTDLRKRSIMGCGLFFGAARTMATNMVLTAGLAQAGREAEAWAMLQSVLDRMPLRQ